MSLLLLTFIVAILNVRLESFHCRRWSSPWQTEIPIKLELQATVNCWFKKKVQHFLLFIQSCKPFSTGFKIINPGISDWNLSLFAKFCKFSILNFPVLDGRYANLLSQIMIRLSKERRDKIESHHLSGFLYSGSNWISLLYVFYSGFPHFCKSQYGLSKW